MDVKGRFFKYRSGTGLIRVRASNGGYVDLLPGQGVWNLNYDSLNVQDRSGAQNAGVLIAGDFDFHDDRITGTVDVVDGGKARTIGAAAFSMACATGGTATLFPVAQIFNPSANKRVIVEQVIFSTDVAAVQRVGIEPALVGGAGAKGISKLSGSSDSAAINSIGQIAGNPAGFKYLATIYQGAGVPATYKFTEPVVLLPGYGMSVGGSVPNQNIIATFEFFEEDM